MQDHSTANRAPRRAPLLAATAVGALFAFSVPSMAEELVIALGSNIATLDPTNAQIVGVDVSLMAHLYSSLTRRDGNGELVGDLATGWEALDDHTWRFTLREGVTFPGGEPLDAEVVKWNIERIRNPETNSRNRAWFTAVETIEVVSPTELKIVTAQPYPALPAQLTMVFFLQPDWVATHNPAVETYGTGAYDLVEFVPGQSATLTADAGFYGDAPAFDTLRYRIVPEPAARVAGIETGELDFAIDIPLEDLERLNGRDGITSDWVASTRTVSLRLNATVEPFASNVDLRRALNYAIDKEAIVEYLLDGKAAVANCQLLSPAYFGYNTELAPYPYDPDRAREMIAASGIGTTPIELQVPMGRYFMASEVAQVLAGQLEEVGLNVQIREYDFATWVQPFSQGEMGPMSMIGQSWPTLDAGGLLTLYTSGNRSGYYMNPEFDAAIAEANSTTDTEARLAAYRKATQIMCDAPPAVFLFHQPLTYATSAKVRWTPRGDDWLLVSDFTPAD